MRKGKRGQKVIPSASRGALNPKDRLRQQAYGLRNVRNFAQAKPLLEELYKLEPDNMPLALDLGEAYMETEDFASATSLYAKLIEKDPKNINAVTNLGGSLIRQGKLNDARSILEYALQLDPKSIHARINLGSVLQASGERKANLDNALEAVQIDPSSSLAFNNLGSAFSDMAMFKEAKHAYETAVILDSQQVDALINLAAVEARLGDSKASAEMYERVLKLLPKEAEQRAEAVKFYAAFEYLKQGVLDKGWDYYEGGFSLLVPAKGARTPRRDFDVPRWDGQPLNGKTLLVWREQGLGDELLFATCLHELEALGGNIIVECDARLVTVFQRSFPQYTIRAETFLPNHGMKSPFSDFDLHLPMGSLMKYFRRDVKDFERSGAYIKPDPVRVADFQKRLEPYRKKGRLVGICWRSGKLDPVRNLGYTELEDWRDALNTPEHVFINLQYGDYEEELVKVELALGKEVIRWGDLDTRNDLEGMFALMKCLDGVLSIQSAALIMASSVGVATVGVRVGGWTRLGSRDKYLWFAKRSFASNPKNALDCLDWYLLQGNLEKSLVNPFWPKRGLMPRKFEERNNYQGIAVDFIFCIKRVYAHTDECRLKLPGPILSLARLLAYLGEYGLAENLVYEAYKKDSDVKNGFTLMAKEACAQGELLQAKKLIELDMEHERTDSKGDIIKSEILASLKESELAKKKFNRIYIEDNKLLSIYFEVAKDLDLKGIINEQELLEGVESFFVETYRKNNRLMAGEITNYYDANALSVDIFSRIGNIHRERRLDLREGLALMQRDYALERQSPEWTLRMAEMYLRCNDLKSALRLVASVYRDNPSIKDGYGRLGCLLASQNLEAGRRLAARDLNSSRLSNQWKIHFALLEYKLGRKDAAFTLIDRTYGADPSMKDAYIALALLESKAGRHLQALDLAERDFISNRLSEKGKVLYAKFVSKRIGENKALGILKDIYARNSLSNELDLIDASKASFYLGGYGLALKFLENAKEKNIAHPKVLNEECRQRSIIATWNWLKVGFCDHGCELGHVLPPKADSYIGLLESVTSCDLSHLEVDYELFHYISRGVLALSLKTDPNSFEKDVLPLIRKSLTYLKLSERSKSDDEVHFFDELLTSLYYQKPIFSIIEQVNLSKHLRFSTFGYLLLADVLAWTGLFNLYHDSRLDAEINAINLKNKNFVDGMPRAFRALISQCRFEEALDLSRDAARVFNVKTSLCWQGYINLASGDTDGFVHLQKRFVENYSSQYYRYMMGKSVAIVGPSGSDEELREEIDQYDIVIRLNWRPVPYSEKLSYKKAVDRVDISYYTKHVFYSLSIEERQSISNKLKFYCLDVIQNSDAQAVSDFSQGKARRPHGNSYLLHKFPSAIQRVVFDVLSYNPKKVKVFKCNFYSSVDLYEKSYEDQIIEMPGIRKSKSIPRESTWAHDLWSNYNFISTLHNYGVIDVDSGCSEILGLGVKSYLSLMQDRHGTNF